MRFNRSDRSLMSDWWFTVDRLMLSGLIFLIVGGVVLSLAASPPVAAKLSLEPFHFFKRHLVFAAPAIALLIGVSLMGPRQARRFCLALYLAGVSLMIVTLLVGSEIKGAVRWLSLGPIALQPSELVKPAFVVISAWLFSESQKRDDVPSLPLAIGTYGIFVGLLVLQPDFGQLLLVTIVWGSMLFVAGLSLVWIGAIAVAGTAGMIVAYFTVPHVASRIDSFFDPASGNTYQSERAVQSFINGGWFGRGPGEGTVKQVLPDAHTDFVFAVAAEEYGLLACLLLLGLYGFIVLRGLAHSRAEPDGFVRLALAGLTALFGLQALINMAVTVGLLPAKGMTLPFISYGGSSLMSMAITMGLALGLARRRPRAVRVGSPAATVTPAREGF